MKKTSLKIRFAALAVSALLSAPFALAQTAPSAPAPLGPEANQSLQEVAKLIQAGKADAAAAKLGALEKDPATTQPMLSLVGALYLQINRPQQALAVLQPLADAQDAEPAVLYNAGRAALLTGNVDAGRAYLTRSVLLEPDSPAARDLGFLTAREGRVVEAYSMLRPWALQNPTDGDARLMAASLALQLERPDAAAELLQNLPDDPAIKLLRGKVQVQKKNGPGAVALLKPLLANHPPGMDLEVRRSLAEAELLAGNAAEAVKLIEGQATGHPSVALLLARAQRQSGHADAALATLKPLADQLPADASALGDPRPAANIALEYADLLAAAGRSQEAGPFFEKSTRFYPRNPEAWKGLARSLEAAGRKEDAQKALAQAAEAAKPPVRPALTAAPAVSAGPAAPPEAPLSEGLANGMRLMSQGQLEPALAAVRQEIGISKTPDPRARLMEARLLLLLKRPEESLKVVEEALKTWPDNADLLYSRGAAQMSLQRWATAEQDFRKALKLSPRHTAAMNDLAVLLMSLGKNVEAQGLLRQVLEINPQDATAAANLEKLAGGQ